MKIANWMYYSVSLRWQLLASEAAHTPTHPAKILCPHQIHIHTIYLGTYVPHPRLPENTGDHTTDGDFELHIQVDSQEYRHKVESSL